MILHRQEPFCLEKVAYYGGIKMKLLTNLMLKCYHHKHSESEEETDSGQSGM